MSAQVHELKVGNTIRDGEAAIYSYASNEGVVLKVDGYRNKSIFKTLVLGFIEKSSQSQVDKVMVLKGPPNETQLGNAKRGPHHILLLKVEDVNISIELMGKGVLIQMGREPNGLVRVSRERYKYKIVASYKAALGYFLGALIDEVLHWERSDKNDFALVLFEKSKKMYRMQGKRSRKVKRRKRLSK